MDRLKRFIDIYVPIEACTLRCEYCYISHHRLFNSVLPTFNYSVATFRKALSQKRLGGICLFNFCAGGETLLSLRVLQYIKALLEEGHYVMVVTNATVNKAFEEMSSWEPDLLERLFFKFSYHFMELKKRNLLDTFFANVRKMRDVGASFTLELTPYDDLIPYIDELKQRAIEEIGAYPHVTVARDEHVMEEKPVLTSLSMENYKSVWGKFNSDLFDFKLSIFEVKRKEFCYAGLWSGFLNMQTGILQQCYSSRWRQNIFEDTSKSIEWRPIAYNCLEPHCFNGHAWIALGDISSIDSPTFAQERNRVCMDGTEWLRPKMKAFLSQRLYENNPMLDCIGKRAWQCRNRVDAFVDKVSRKLIKTYKKNL